VSGPDEGTAEGHTYPTTSRTTSRGEALEQVVLSRQGSRIGDPLSDDQLV